MTIPRRHRVKELSHIAHDTECNPNTVSGKRKEWGEVATATTAGFNVQVSVVLIPGPDPGTPMAHPQQE